VTEADQLRRSNLSLLEPSLVAFATEYWVEVYPTVGSSGYGWRCALPDGFGLESCHHVDREVWGEMCQELTFRCWLASDPSRIHCRR
jgi:hypothetical protein